MYHKRHLKHQNKKYCALFFAALLFFWLLSELVSCYYRRWFALPFSLHFIPTYLVLAPGDRHTLKLNGVALRVSYQSSNPFHATVTETGVLYAVSCGKATITATIHNRDNKKITCRVVVTRLNTSKLTLKKGHSYHLRLKGVWSGISYQSSDSSVVSVSRFGWLKAKKTGTAVITVTCHNKAFECIVTVP